MFGTQVSLVVLVVVVAQVALVTMVAAKVALVTVGMLLQVDFSSWRWQIEGFKIYVLDSRTMC